MGTIYQSLVWIIYTLFVGEMYTFICGDRIYNECVNILHIVSIVVTIYAGFVGT